jgi:hypothetical protein
MFLMSLKSVCKWLVMTELELLVNILGILAFTIILCLKCDVADAQVRINLLRMHSSKTYLTWDYVFMPLFITDFFQAYFCCIVFVRQFIEYQRKAALKRFSIAAILLLCRFLFKAFLFALISNDAEHNQNNSPSLSSSSPPPLPSPPSSSHMKYQVAFMPLFVHLGLVLFRSCELKKHQTLN